MMPKALICGVLSFALPLICSAQLRIQRSPGPDPKLIRAGRVLDVRTGQYRLDQGILIEGEKIKEIGPWADVQPRAPGNAVMIDLSRATVLPGLIDSHAHLLISGDLGRIDPGELLMLTLTQTSPSKRALLGARNAKEVLDAGITSARILGHSGVDGDVALRDAIDAGWTSGPRLQVAGRKITAIGGQATSLQPAAPAGILAQEFLIVSGPEHARAAVRENLANGADLIKIVVDSDAGRNWKTRYMPVEDAKTIVEDAHRLGMKVAAHAADNSAVQTAIDAGVDSIEHAWTATDEQLKQMKAKGIFLVATEVFVSASGKDRLERAMKIGVKIAMGSDAWAAVRCPARLEAKQPC
jgi:imidazolonepropionase-like amidohydrolase